MLFIYLREVRVCGFCGEFFTNGINDLKKVSFDSIIDVVRLYRFNCG